MSSCPSPSPLPTSSPLRRVASSAGSAHMAGALLTIDLDAIADNWRLLKRKGGPQTQCASVVKANAYGLGLSPIGPTLYDAGCRAFFVAHVEEGIALRKLIPADSSVFVLLGAPEGAEDACAAHSLTPILNSLPQTRAWARLCEHQARKIPAGLQVDSGMSRAGLDSADIETLLNTTGLMESFTPCLIMSHLACADMPTAPMNAQQLATFKAIRARFPTLPASFSNSSAIFLGADWHFDILRPGAALYGLNPTPGKPNPMKEVVRLRGKIMQIRTVPRGTPVGYGGTFITPKKTRLATVSVGYGDGFFRALGGAGHATWGDYDLPIVGRVSMDMITLDISSVPEDLLRRETLVDLIGPRRPLTMVADEAGTIGYEILTNMGHRYHRTYLCGGQTITPSSFL